MKTPFNELTAPLLHTIILNVILGIFITGSYLLQAWLFTRLIQTALMPGAVVYSALIVALIGNVLGRATLIGLRTMHTEQLASCVRTRLRQQLFRPLLAPGYAVMQHHSAGQIQGTLVEGVEVMESFYSRYLPALLLAITGGAAIVITVMCFDMLSAVILLLFMIGCPLPDALFMRNQRHHIVGVFAAMQRFADDLMDTLRGMLTLKAFNAVDRFRGRIADHAALLRSESMSTLRVTMMRGGITRLMTLLGVASLLLFNAWRVAQGTLEPAILLFTLFLSWEAFRPILQLESVFHILWSTQSMRPAIHSLTSSTAYSHDPIEPSNLPNRHDIHFLNVTYRWPAQQKPLFENLSLHIAENRHTAFIGPSGSGKSTLIQLITRFVAPEAGHITLGGVMIDELSIAALRSRISWVSQDVFLIDGSLSDNLRLSRPDATEPEIWQALHYAQLANWVRHLTNQLNTDIGENGGLLSGGQRQRLSIARALLKQSPILILDEVTSNLDAANETALQEVIASLHGNCTLISIAHRLNTVAHADHIVVLQEGQILEQGSPAQLKRLKGYYASLQPSPEATP